MTRRPDASGAAPEKRVRLPTVRGECTGPGLCIKFACRYNLTLEVTEAGAIFLRQPKPRGRPVMLPALADGEHDARYPRWQPGAVDAFVDEVVAALEGVETNCALDVADRGEQTLTAIGALLRMHKQGAAHLERLALRKLAIGLRAAARRDRPR